MKKNQLYTLHFVIILIGFFLLYNCSDSNENKKYKIGFSQCISVDEWRKSMDHAMKVEASLYSNLDLTILQANRNSETQVSQIDSMIDNDFDVIIISPLESESIVPVVEKAYNKGIPVILVDRNADTNLYTTYLGADNLEVGELAGKYLVSSSKGKANVVEIYGDDATFVGIERSKGFYNVIKDYPNVKLISRSKAKIGINPEEFSSILDSFPNIDYVYAFNDLIAEQAWQIAKTKGRQDKIQFIGIDGLNFEGGGIDLVLNGTLLCTVLYPTGGSESINLAQEIINGQKVPHKIKLNTIVIDSLNAGIMKKQFDKIDQHQLDIENQQKKINQQQKTYSTLNNILKVVLVLLITSIVLGAYSIYSRNSIRKKKRELELQNKRITIQRNQIKKIAEDLKISNDAKINFFTGLSHEFKTPITLILSSTESLYENNVIRKHKLLNEINLIFNNSKRLLRLINQLLDFRKIEDRKFVLKASKTNIYQFSKNIFKDFELEAQRRNIKFTLTSNNEDLYVYIDRNLMDKVYFNLLSNAFKFTPNNGSIILDIRDLQDTNFVEIHFIDSGIGILKSELDKVFKPFFQGSNNTKMSSGIGLHLSKEFIELHKGTIEVTSKHGTEFIITLYKGNAHLDSDEIVYEPDIIDESVMNLKMDYQDEALHLLPTSKSKERYSILIIEDNLELITFLKSKLGVEYEVYTSDGADAIGKAMELIPDIIISDYNLPDKNGFEICQILKNDLRTSHIPIIVLTAFDNKEFYVEGLQAGADLYLTKPFSLGILHQSLKTLLYNREKLRYYYINNIYKIDHNDTFDVSQQEFLSKLNSIVNKNLDNSNFSVENLADSLNISRVQLYRKIKAILGINISDHIQNIRLEKAKTMMMETNLTISEIAYAVGFSSPNYFSTAFKNKYGESPKTYRTSQ